MLHVIRKYIPGIDFSDFMFEEVERMPEVTVHRYHERKPRGLFKRLRLSVCKELAVRFPKMRRTGKALFDRDFVERLKQIAPDDDVLIFDIWNLKLQEVIISLLPKGCRVMAYIWDNVSAFYGTDRLQPRYLRAARRRKLCTFDEADALRYEMCFVGQVFRRRLPSEPVEPAYDVLYIGQELGRGDMISAIADELRQAGLHAEIHIVPPRKAADRNARLEPFYLKEFLPYSRVYDMVQRTRCILEINKPYQTGYTLRTLEALFYDKKLITTNPALLRAPFYRRENIYVLGHEPKRTLTEFMQTPMAEIPEAEKRPYMIEHWLEQFSRKKLKKS